MTFGSWTEDADKLVLATHQDHVDVTAYQTNGEWDLLDTSVEQPVFAGATADWVQVRRSVNLVRMP